MVAFAETGWCGGARAGLEGDSAAEGVSRIGEERVEAVLSDNVASTGGLE